MGEHPTLGTYSSPRMRRADIEVQPSVDMDSGEDQLLSPGYLLSVERHRFHSQCRITIPAFALLDCRLTVKLLVHLHSPPDCQPG